MEYSLLPDVVSLSVKMQPTGKDEWSCFADVSCSEDSVEIQGQNYTVSVRALRLSIKAEACELSERAHVLDRSPISPRAVGKLTTERGKKLKVETRARGRLSSPKIDGNEISPIGQAELGAGIEALAETHSLTREETVISGPASPVYVQNIGSIWKINANSDDKLNGTYVSDKAMLCKVLKTGESNTYMYSATLTARQRDINFSKGSGFIKSTFKARNPKALIDILLAKAAFERLELDGAYTGVVHFAHIERILPLPQEFET